MDDKENILSHFDPIIAFTRIFKTLTLALLTIDVSALITVVMMLLGIEATSYVSMLLYARRSYYYVYCTVPVYGRTPVYDGIPGAARPCEYSTGTT